MLYIRYTTHINKNDFVPTEIQTIAFYVVIHQPQLEAVVSRLFLCLRLSLDALLLSDCL